MAMYTGQIINEIFRGLGDEYVKPHITCKDGFKMSVQASETHYCEPRQSRLDYYYSFEVGYPTEDENLLFQYADDPENPHDSSVFGYVPAYILDEIIEKHGGVA